MLDNGKEDARKRGGGINEGGGSIHDTNSFRCGKIGGGVDKRGGAL